MVTQGPALFAGFLALFGYVVAVPDTQEALSRPRWLGTWAAMPQLCETWNMPPAPFTQNNSVFYNATLRQSLKISLPGPLLRLRISNAYGPTSLPLTAVTIALPANESAVGTPSIRTETLQTVTFSGDISFSVPAGAQAVSDPLKLNVSENGVLTVSIYLAQGQSGNYITAHPGSRTTSYFVFGDQTRAAALNSASVAEHWYFISGVEVVSSDPKTVALAIIGDSITDGYGSTKNGNDRWPDQLYTRIRAYPPIMLAYLNQGADGNRVLLDGLGPSALSRIDRDILSQPHVKQVILFEGVNDIGVAEATRTAQDAIVHNLIVGYKQIITRVRALDLKIYGATITPFGGHHSYDDGGLREASRQAVNMWIQQSYAFDAVLDFDEALRDPKNATQLNPVFDSGDHLHPNPAGYRQIAEAVPLELLAL